MRFRLLRSALVAPGAALLIILPAIPAAGTEARPGDTPAVPEVSVASHNWLNPSWAFRMQLTVDPGAIEGSSPFLDFPLLLRLNGTHSSVFLNGKSDGSDLVVTKADGQTALSREIVGFDPSEPNGEIWFRADSLSTTGNVFYLYYGNPDTTLDPVDGTVWTPDFLGVYHFAEDPGAGILKDYGPNGNNATAGFQANFTSADTIEGPVGQAWKFNGTTHWVDGDAISSSDSSFVISAWFGCWNQFREGDADFAFSVQTGFWHLSAKRNSVQRLPDFAISGRYFTWHPNPLPDTLSHHFVWAMDGEADTMRFYFDGEEQDVFIRYVTDGGPVYTGLNISGNVGIASPLYGNSNPWDLMEGVVDEYRIREGFTTPEWVATEYRNQTLAGFYTFGPPEPYSTTGVQVLTFRAIREPQGGARVEWELPEDAPRSLFDVYRDDGAGERLRITPSSVLVTGKWSLLDPGAPPGETLYWLAELSGLGEIMWHGPALLPASEPASRPGLSQSFPNPFRSSTWILYTLERSGPVRLRIFDTQGREVATLVDRTELPGRHQVEWDGLTESGSRAAPGIYFYRLETASGVHSRRLVRLR